MIVIKVPLKEAQRIKNYIKKNKLIDYNYLTSKDSKFIYFPVKEKTKELAEFTIVKKKLKKQERKETKLKKYLEEKLTPSELEKVKTSFEVVGDIAIVEIPSGMENKEKILAHFLLDSHKNIKTVLKKAGIHTGEFRTQKMKYLAGAKTKEALHRENKAVIKLNVEEVYFSARLGNERLRIAKQVKPGEKILVMFSGCAPYPLILSKNTLAKEIVGIELNPVGHKYGLENIKLNKVKNIQLFNDDVKKRVPKLIYRKIGLKSNVHEKDLHPRLEEHPCILEFYLRYTDLFHPRLEHEIQKLKDKTKIVLHVPYFDEETMNLFSSPEIAKKGYARICRLVDKYPEIHGVIIHPVEFKGPSIKQIVEKIKKFKPYYDKFYFENMLHGPFAKKETILEIIKKAGIKKICIDVAHLYRNYKSNKKVIELIKAIKNNVEDTYFHICDSTVSKEGLIFGKGKINIEKILPYVNQGVVEIVSTHEYIGRQMIKGYEMLEKWPEKFDRILMPLPKSAGDFLQTAFVAAKKGTIIHFYDFLYEKDIPIKAIDKIKKEAKKAKLKVNILRTVKCGQHAPRTFRVCVDFEVL